MNHLLVHILASAVYADMRIALDNSQTDPQGNKLAIPFQMPDTFQIANLVNQKKNDLDNFIRTNVVQEANKRNTATEPALDMLPCRSYSKSAIQSYAPGETVYLPQRWNNAHDSDCEVNLWQKNMTVVAPLMRPRPCGGGYQDQQIQFTVAPDVKGCESEADGCVMQLYAHSVEPRSYVLCINVVITGTPKQGAPKSKFDTSVPNYQTQPAIQYNDAFDVAHYDSEYSGYNGQQGPFIRDEVKAAIQLQSFVGNGGLIPLGDVDVNKNKEMRTKIQNAIKENEKKAIALNNLAQQQLNSKLAPGEPKKCYEGELYGVVNNPNCVRQYTNTYVTGVGYRDIYNRFLPELQSGGFVQYEPQVKTLIGGDTPKDEYGSYKVGGKASLVPQGVAATNPPKQWQPRTAGSEPASIQSLATQSKQAPLPIFIKSPAQANADAGSAQIFGSKIASQDYEEVNLPTYINLPKAANSASKSLIRESLCLMLMFKFIFN